MKKFNVCIVGGGSTYTLGFLKSFVRLKEEFPLSKLVLFDIDAKRQEPIGKYGEIMFAERYPDLEFAYTTDPKTAYGKSPKALAMTVIDLLADGAQAADAICKDFKPLLTKASYCEYMDKIAHGE